MCVYALQTVRLIVDHCESSIVDESINGTSEIRTSCESSHTYINGDQFLLNVNTPLEVGGKSTSYPGGITTTGFNGCLKNLRYNDKVISSFVRDNNFIPGIEKINIL